MTDDVSPTDDSPAIDEVLDAAIHGADLDALDRSRHEVAETIHRLKAERNACEDRIAAARGAVEAIRGIGETVGRIDEVSAMSQSASQAAAGVTEMAGEARDGSQAASDVLGASQKLAANADSLQQRISDFCDRVRAG